MSTPRKPASELVPRKERKTASKLTFLPKVIKGDTYMVMAQSGLEPEDEFGSLYFTVNDGANTIMKPPFDPKVLANMVYQNNILSQCVDAMEVNVSGTGHEFVPVDDDTEANKDEEARAKGFFDEPYPQQSMVNIRRMMQRDLEGIGYAFLEILRNPAGELVGLRHVPAYMIRFVKLDAPVQVEKTVIRGGKEVKLTLWERERRFVQKVGGKNMRYFKEYGSTRKLNVDTGQWEGQTEAQKNTGTPPITVPKDKEATELKVFLLNPDTATPYALPRWINQMPSVIGSRKAEENNLEFFDAGGIPPAIIFIQGGTLAGDMSNQLKMYLSGQTKSRNRAVVVEAQSSSGSLDAAGSVQVKVERFGSERANDAMFMQYDETTEDHVRTGFRLPPLFLGKAADYNFATAQTAYMVAEAQIFEPERCRFDEWVNRSIMRELGCKTIKFKSLPITLKDVTAQINAMTVVANAATPDSLVNEVNKVAGLTLEHQDPVEAATKLSDAQHQQALAQHPAKLAMTEKEKELEQRFAPPPTAERMQVKPGHKVLEFPQGGKVRTIKFDVSQIMDLTRQYMEAEGLTDSEASYSDADRDTIRKTVDALEDGDRKAFWSLVSLRTFGREDMIELVDHEGHDH